MKIKFILQTNKDNEFLDTFVYDVYSAILQHNWFYDEKDKYFYIKSSKIENVNLEDNFLYIPVGSVEFIEDFFKLNNIEVPKPLNIPSYLRRVRYTRNIIEDITYLDLISNLEKYKNYYIKSAEKYKHFDVTNGRMIRYTDVDFQNNTQLYVSSEIIPKIIQEFRVFVLNDRILSINNYITETLFYKIDEHHVELLFEIIGLVRQHQSELKAYTIDYVVSEDRGFSLLELHHGYSCGNYGFNGENYMKYIIGGIKQFYENRKL
jgi:hypothetical protein